MVKSHVIKTYTLYLSLDDLINLSIVFEMKTQLDDSFSQFPCVQEVKLQTVP